MNIKINCLPVAGIENPYQKLMMEGLSSNAKFLVNHGVEGKVFAIIKTAFSKPVFIHFDWIHQYYLRRSHWMTWMNFPLFCLEIIIVKYVLKVKLVWTLHNITPHDQPYFGPYKWARIFFAKQCEWIRVFSQNTADKASIVLGISKNKFKVVPEGSYVDYYPNDISREAARQILNIKESKRVVLFFGSMRPYKGLECLINIYQKIRTEDTILIIAGQCVSQEYKKELGKLIIGYEDILLEARTIDVNDVQLYMNASDIVVLPFIKVENSGSTILAMGFAKPIVAPKIGVIPERLKHQLELLYEDNLEQILHKTIHMTKDQLLHIGQKNYNNLFNHKWTDFGQAFK